MSQNATEILDTMLGYLGFVCEIKENVTEHGSTLQVYTPEKQRLIGRDGETLDDIQFLLNRLLQVQDKDAPRVQVDVEHYREMREDVLVQKVRQVAEVVRKTGRPMHLDPMNAYDRRIIHNAFKNDREVMTWSPPEENRMKQITLRRRPTQPAA